MTDFLSKQYTQQYRHQEITSANATVLIWTPPAGSNDRIALTGLDIRTGLAGTIRFDWGAASDIRIVEYGLTASSSISPRFNTIECTAVQAGLYASGSVAGEGGWRITVYGFEIPNR